MADVVVDVVTYAPTVFFHCQHCELTFRQVGIGDRVHREEAREALPDDLLAQYHEVCDWLTGLRLRHGDRVQVRVTDAASIAGVWRSLRHGIRTYPAVVVDGRLAGDLAEADPVVEEALATGT